jgi:hypothetical protein
MKMKRFKEVLSAIGSFIIVFTVLFFAQRYTLGYVPFSGIQKMSEMEKHITTAVCVFFQILVFFDFPAFKKWKKY